MSVVRCSDRLHDGESEPEAAVVAGAVGVRTLKRLEQPVDLRRSQHRPGVANREHRVAVNRLRHDFDAAINHVVPQGVVDEVGDESLGEFWVTDSRRRVEPSGNIAALVVSASACRPPNTEAVSTTGRMDRGD